jgi:hypothetical protein
MRWISAHERLRISSSCQQYRIDLPRLADLSDPQKAVSTFQCILIHPRGFDVRSQVLTPVSWLVLIIPPPNADVRIAGRVLMQLRMQIETLVKSGHCRYPKMKTVMGGEK